jgi:hypothetical protein
MPFTEKLFLGRFMNNFKKRVFISADHGLAIVYFLQSDVVPALIEAGIEVVLLTDDALKNQIEARFGMPGLIVEGLRLKEARAYFQRERTSTQWWLDFLRRAGASSRINLQAVDSAIRQVEAEAHIRRRRLFPLMRVIVGLLRHSRLARQALVQAQARFTSNLYTDLFERYQPSMTIASTPGWRLDRYILRESAARGIPNTTVIVGWDNTSSYSLPGARMDWATCWSELQKQEMVDGSDWDPARVNVGGIPSYDGYFSKRWVMPKEKYFHLHDLDPSRKLISFACSFVSFSPNIQDVEALAALVTEEQLAYPAQLLVRLHPNHFMDVERFIAEREQIQALAHQLPHVHVVEPVPLGGELGYYSGEDMPEKSSMMAHSDVFTTVYSTMVVEAATHGRPVVSVCIDSPVGWPGKYTLPLSKIGGWPTHARFLEAGAGRVAFDREQLRQTLNFYLENPEADQGEREAFIRRECTYTDGSAGRRTTNFLLSLL